MIRKIYWALYAEHAHVKGIGGPGAPHSFRLDRFEDLGHSREINFVKDPIFLGAETKYSQIIYIDLENTHQ